jgi:hypothetical protein
MLRLGGEKTICSGLWVQKHALSTEFVSLAENGMPAFENFFLKTGR